MCLHLFTSIGNFLKLEYTWCMFTAPHRKTLSHLQIAHKLCIKFELSGNVFSKFILNQRPNLLIKVSYCSYISSFYVAQVKVNDGASSC